MTRRGLALVLQRLHDDPLFLRGRGEQALRALALYDLDSEERAVLSAAIKSGDIETLADLAGKLGMNWSMEEMRPALPADEVDTPFYRNPNESFLDNQPVDYETPSVGHWGKGVARGHPGFGRTRDHHNLPPEVE